MNINKDNLRLLVGLLGFLRALKWNYWNSHWMVSGEPYYGDHLLFERLYSTVIDDQIDTLAEKIVAYDPSILREGTMRSAFNSFLDKYQREFARSPVQRGIAMERKCKKSIKTVYEELKSSGCLSLGMDDFLMATASERETAFYLLNQRARNT